ncbi:MAG: O-antigen ligase family protein [Methyloceanibacter sp.]
MSNLVGLESTQRFSGKIVVPTLFFLSPVITAAVPRLTWLFLALLALALIFAAQRRNEGIPLFEWNAALIAVLIVIGYVFLNSTWAVDSHTALNKALLITAVSLSTFAVAAAVPRIDSSTLRKAAVTFALGGFVAAFFITFELLTDGAITRLALNSIQLLHRPNAKHATILYGQIAHLNPSDLNQNVAILTLNLWPMLLALQVEDPDWRSMRPVMFLVMAGIPVLLSEHQSSQLALVLSSAVYVVARLWPRPVVRGLAALWCAAFLLVLPADFLAYKAGLHEASWLPSSFRARVIIWEYTAEKVFDHPWLGIGADSTRALNELHQAKETPPGFIFPRTSAWHAHDLFLQTLFELGVVGAVLMAIAGAAAILRISLLPAPAQPFAAAGLTCFLTIASFGWGMWQTWLICGVALFVLYLLTLSDLSRRERHAGRSYEAWF